MDVVMTVIKAVLSYMTKLVIDKIIDKHKNNR